MNLPIYIRKFWIQKHNRQAQEEADRALMEQWAGGGKGDIGPGSVNGYARIEQQKIENGNSFVR